MRRRHQSLQCCIENLFPHVLDHLEAKPILNVAHGKIFQQIDPDIDLFICVLVNV